MDFNHLHDHDLHICHVKKGVMCETNTVWLRRFELSLWYLTCNGQEADSDFPLYFDEKPALKSSLSFSYY